MYFSIRILTIIEFYRSVIKILALFDVHTFYIREKPYAIDVHPDFTYKITDPAMFFSYLKIHRLITLLIISMFAL